LHGSDTFSLKARIDNSLFDEAVPAKDLATITQEELKLIEEDKSLIREDASAFALLGAVQLLPMLHAGAPAIVVYFMLTACLTVYLGAKRSDLSRPEAPITTRQAALAPVVSSIFLFGMYLVLKNTPLNPEILLQVFGTLFGFLSGSVVFTSLTGAIFPQLTTTEVDLPQWVEDNFLERPVGAPEEYRPKANLSSIVGLGTGFLLCAVYLNPAIPVLSKFYASNIIAWAIAMESVAAIALESFIVACLFLGGLFLYDAWWVYGTDVMVTVATKVEAPVKFLFPVDGRPADQYPFAVLGLGDLVIPGVFCSLMRKVDKKVVDPPSDTKGGMTQAVAFQDATTTPELKKQPYFFGSIAAYTVGLGLTFAANKVTGNGQPALFFLVPSLLSSSLLVAAARQEISQLFQFNTKKFSDDDS